jgi:hemolysin activation/secretion protein
LCLVPPLAAWPLLPALAQTPPNAGSLLQQLERGSEPRLPGRADKPRAEPLPQETPKSPGIAVAVKQFRFAGNTLLSEDALRAAVAPWVNRTVDFTELRKAAAAAAEAYRAAGWIARAYLPRQDITDGEVVIQIAEAAFGTARVENRQGEAPLRLKFERVLLYVDAAQKKGAPLSAAALDRALLLIEDLPGTGVSGSLTPGAHEGETDLALKLSAKPLFTGDVALDNAGSRATGSTRLTASLALNSALGYGEQATANLLYSEGSEYLRLAATLPAGTDGWRVGANASALRYQLTAPEFAALEARGHSETAGLEASYPLLRSRLSNVYLNLNADHKRFDNRSLGASVTRYRVNNLAAGLNANHFDNWGGGGASAASVHFVTGKVNLNGSPNQAADAATTQSAGTFHKIRYAASRRQALTETLAALASFSGQWANKNLDSSEKFYLGGPYGVRAYPVNEGGGSSGQLLNLETRAALPGQLSLSAFYDWGHVVVNRHQDFPGAAVINAMTLQGAGLALGWTGPGGTQVRATWARRIGDNPNPTATGLDQDGSKVRNRFWLSASLSF